MKILVNKRSVCLYLGLLIVVIGAGCASTNKTTTTKTTEIYPVNEGNRGYLNNTRRVVSSNGQQNNVVTQKSETTTTVTSTEDNAEHRSLLGATLHTIGWVIALPFRIVGGLIGQIF